MAMFSKSKISDDKAKRGPTRRPSQTPPTSESVFTPEFQSRIRDVGARGEEYLKRVGDLPFEDAGKATGEAVKRVRRTARTHAASVPSEVTGWTSKLRRYLGPIALFVIGAMIIYSIQREQAVPFGRGFSVDAQVASALGVTFLGFLIGFLPVLAVTRFAPWALAVLGLVIVWLITTPVLGATLLIPLGVLAFIGGMAIAAYLFIKVPRLDTDAYGSARRATRADIEKAELFEKGGYRLADYQDDAGTNLISYAGQRHLLTCAPTRAGKGTSAIIPNLLTYEGSMLVIDPKGENLMVTAEQRHRLGHDVQALDPWNIGASFFEGGQAARFNPLDFVDADSPDLVENAMILAEALVPVGGGDSSFWDEEAKALLMGIILHVATDPEEQAHRHLPRVRDLLLGDDEDMDQLFERMMASDNTAVRGAGARAVQKEPKMRSSVLATAQSHTHFLDSPRIRESMSASDFRFGDMKREKLSIYVILPADRLSTFDRWLRLIISIAIIENARNIDIEPEKPVLFMLDEMAALGRLKPVETAFGLMAGFGMQLWGIVQDLSQLERIYGKGWETFVGNSGVLQYFGSRDKMTAEYFSALCGTKTAKTIAGQIKQALWGGVEEPGSYSETGRPLFMPDELMVMKADRQLLLVETNYPIVGRRVAWFDDPVLKKLGRNLKG